MRIHGESQLLEPNSTRYAIALAIGPSGMTRAYPELGLSVSIQTTSTALFTLTRKRKPKLMSDAPQKEPSCLFEAGIKGLADGDAKL